MQVAIEAMGLDEVSARETLETERRQSTWIVKGQVEEELQGGLRCQSLSRNVR